MIGYNRKLIQKDRPYFFKRKTEVDSKISVKVGEVVQPETIIAYSWKKSGFRVFNLADLFDIDVEEAKNTLLRTVGSRIYQGDELAAHKQWFGLKERVFSSPITGVFTDYNSDNSKITLQYLPEEMKLTSGVYGKVSEVIPGKLISIGTRVDSVRAVIGFGVRREGSLVEIGYPDIPIQADQILPKHENKIIFGGTRVTLDALYKALSVGARGVITGGMDYDDFVHLIGSQGRLENVGISIFLTEGFGSLPIYQETYDFLRSSEYRHVILLPKSSNIVIPVSSDYLDESRIPVRSESVTAENDSQRYGLINKGMKVRLLVESLFGQYGIVSDVDKASRTIEVSLAKNSYKVSPEHLEIIS